MPESPLPHATIDPTSIFEHFRGNHGTELLTAAAAHFRLFDKLAAGPLAWHELRSQLALAERPLVVLITALRAMRLIERASDKYQLTPLAREHLVSTSPLSVADYIGLAAESPGVLAMVERLRTDLPAGAKSDTDEGAGTAFIYREGTDSAMEQEASARHLTLALAGRAKNVAPVLADVLPLAGDETLLDLGGGTGIYSIALLRKYPQLRAIVLDRPEVLKVAHEFAEQYGVADRLQLLAGDMFSAALPAGVDRVLLSNILHDWDVPECIELLKRSAAALSERGEVLIHDVFLSDELDGPLPIALYSAALFTLTEGRAYSAAEYRAMLGAAGLTAGQVIPTLIHCGVLAARRAS